MEEIHLDLHKVTLLGWEPEKSRQYVRDIVRKVRKGYDFPAVPVRKIGDNLYILCRDIIDEETERPDGGHNRAIAHYKARKPLKCRLVEERKDFYCPEFFPIQDIHLFRERKYHSFL